MYNIILYIYIQYIYMIIYDYICACVSFTKGIMMKKHGNKGQFGDNLFVQDCGPRDCPQAP